MYNKTKAGEEEDPLDAFMAGIQSEVNMLLKFLIASPSNILHLIICLITEALNGSIDFR